MRFSLTPFVVTAFSIFVASRAEAAPPPVKNGPVAAVEALVDDQAIVVIHADLTRVDLSGVLTSAPIFLAADGQMAKMSAQWNGLAEQFIQAGGRDLYLVVSLADVPEQPPYWLAPLAKDADEERLGALFEALGCEVRQRIGGVLFAGSREALERVEHRRAAARPEISKALAAIDGAAVQIVVAPTAEARRVVEELQPTLPLAAGGGPSTALTRGALWLSLGIDTAPRLSARVVVQSQNHGAAMELGGRWGQWYRLLAQMTGGPMASKLMGVEGRLTPDVKGDRLVLELDAARLEQVRTVLHPSLNFLEERIRFQTAINNLKQIGMAMHAYLDAHKHLPAAAISDDGGKPLLSWRVALLPHLGQGPLYHEFRLNEPWDSEHNARLIERMPDVFRSPGQRNLPAGRTTYLVPVGEDTIFHGREGTPFQDIKDGTSNTLLAVEADNDHAVIWTKPDDWSIGGGDPATNLGSPYDNHILVLLCDGAVLTLKWPLEADVLRSLLTYDGGEVVDYGPLMWRGDR